MPQLPPQPPVCAPPPPGTVPDVVKLLAVAGVMWLIGRLFRLFRR